MLILRKLILLILLLAVSGAGVHAQESFDLEASLPLTPDVRQGVWITGSPSTSSITSKPAERAEMHLVLRVGALQETEDQLGLAHSLNT